MVPPGFCAELVVVSALVLLVVGTWVVVVLSVMVTSVVDLAAVVVGGKMLAGLLVELILELDIGDVVEGMPPPFLRVETLAEVIELVGPLDTDVVDTAGADLVDAGRPVGMETLEETAPADGLKAMSTLEFASSGSCSCLK